MKYLKLHWFIPFFLIGVFLFQYVLIIDFIKNAFHNSNITILENALNDEKDSFYIDMYEKITLILSQFIGGVISLNIGLLYFKYKVNFKSVGVKVTNSFIVLIITRIIILLIVFFSNINITEGSIESIENRLYITNYLNLDNILPYFILPLKTLNITHLFFVLTLAYGVQELIQKNYRKSLIVTIKTYGFGVLLWCVFATIMEMNFN